jgi:phosphoribosylanthranilate isomerase
MGSNSSSGFSKIQKYNFYPKSCTFGLIKKEVKMALKTFVKISSVNNLTDARYCAGMYVNQIGFDIDPDSTDHIFPEKYKEITAWLSGVDYVGEFNDASPEIILETVKQYPGIACIEIKNHTHIPLLLDSGYGLILKKEIASDSDLEDLLSNEVGFPTNHMTLLLTSTTLNAEGNTLTLIRKLAEKFEVLLGFGLSAENVGTLIEDTGIKGIAMEAGDEIKPGLKDFDQLADILELLELED